MHDTCGATVRVRWHARGWYTNSVRTVVLPRGKLPCASGTYSTQEAGTRSPEALGRTCEHSLIQQRVVKAVRINQAGGAAQRQRPIIIVIYSDVGLIVDVDACV